MITREYSIEFDMMKKNNTEDMNFVSQDYKTSIINIKLLSNDTPINLNGLEVEIHIFKPDGKVCNNDIEIVDADNGLIKIELTTQSISVAGTSKAEISITELSTNKKITSKEIFQFSVRKNYDNDNVIKSINEFSELQKMIEQINNQTICWQDF
jgi:hypothetical protein